LGSNSNVYSRIDQQAGALPAGIFPDDSYRFSRQNFQVAYRQVFFAQLDQVHAGAAGFCDLGQQASALLSGSTGKLPPIRNVVENQVFTAETQRVRRNSRPLIK
jgi:hypothetical protein